MIVASTLIAIPLIAVALVARLFRSDLEEAAWRLIAVVMLAMPLAPLLPKIDVGFELPLAKPEVLATSGVPLVAMVYIAVALFLLVRLAVSAIAALVLRRRAQPFGDAYLSPLLRVPVTAGLFAPAVLLPHDAPAWSEAKLAAVLAHERAHVARRDPLWRFIGRAAAAVCWIHPLAWIAASSIERLAEESADREAIARIGDRSAYANVILDFLHSMTSGRHRLLAAGILDGRSLAARIDHILQPAPARRSRRITRIVLAAFVCGAIFVTGMTTNETRPFTPAERAVTLAQQRRSDLEFFHRRDEIRRQFRESVQSFFRALFHP